MPPSNLAPLRSHLALVHRTHTRMELYLLPLPLLLLLLLLVKANSISGGYTTIEKDKVNELQGAGDPQHPDIILQRVKRSENQYSEEELDRLFEGFGTNRRSRQQTRHHRHHPPNDEPRQHRHHHHHQQDDEVPRQQGQHREHQHRNRRTRNRQEQRSRGRRPRPTLPATLPTSFDIYDVTTPMTSPGPSTEEPKPTLLVGSAYERNRLLRPSRTSENFVDSGQMVRLRDGRTSNEGRVEIFRDNRWGLVCDDDWELEDAHVVCRQLGFTHGARSAIGGAAYGSGEFSHGDILMDEIECEGSEETLQDCPHATLHDCLLSEAASVICIPNTGCEDGWWAGLGLCYRLMPQLATFESANAKCGQLDAHLLTVESQRESDFISEWLMAETNETYFFTAGQKQTQDGTEYWWWKNTLYAVSFTKWFPGWPPHGVMDQPSDNSGQNCLTLASTFYTERLKMRNVNYFFWNDAPCSVRLPFICEKVARYPDECYVGNGMDYRGHIHRTEAGTLCQSWAHASAINPTTHPGKGLGDHNECRNPDADSRPWCWIDSSRQKFGFCAISSCDDLDRPTTSAPTTSPPTTHASADPTTTINVDDGFEVNGTITENPCGEDMFVCWGAVSHRCIPARWHCDGEDDCGNGDDERDCEITEPTSTPPTTTTAPPTQVTGCGTGLFHCSRSLDYRLCLPVRWRCDKERDCPDGEDEEDCVSELDQVSRTSQFKLVVSSNVSNYHEVTYAQASVQQCSTLCVHNRAFVCRSFNYHRSTEKCTLYDVNADVTGQLHPDENYNYYEVIIQRENCTFRSNLFRCDNGKCIEPEQVCDGVDNCNDFSDEHFCSDSDVSLRLAGGRNEHEGRVEVRYHGEWGIICDDSWDRDDAEVVCRQLGYVGAITATVMSRFGYGNGNFLLDEVDCRGDETSLTECEHAHWRAHNCLTYETAGVICRTGKACRANQYTCSDGTCIAASSLCDNQRQCSDGGDEEDCSDMSVNLVGGTQPGEGRVEITLKGLKGTVCDDQWDDRDAEVVCRMMGFSFPAIAASFGNGSGVIWLDNVHCGGSETNLLDCDHNGWAVHNCAHSEDAGVRCGVGRPTLPSHTTTEGYDNANSDNEIPTPPHECGRRPVTQSTLRIVGGYNARYGAYPWQAGIQKQGWLGGYSHHCGATIIDDRWVLSAAHCFYGKSKSIFRVTTGDWDLTREDIFEHTYDIDEIIMHNRYSSNTHDHDFALVKLSGTIRFTDFVQPACLPSSSLTYTEDAHCVVSGWGRTGSGAAPSHLKAAVVPLMSESTCRRLYKYSLTDRMFCAGYMEGNIDTCQGDSGGPLVCLTGTRYTVLGVTSWGNGCAQPNSPGVYAKVSQITDWIRNTMQHYA